VRARRLAAFYRVAKKLLELRSALTALGFFALLAHACFGLLFFQPIR
jgi:hypothetical protein